MSTVPDASVPLSSADGAVVAHLHIFQLPQSTYSNPPPLLDLSGDPSLEAGVPGIQLLESQEYRYVWEGIQSSNLVTDPREIFYPDTDDGRSGRLRPALATGNLRVVLREGDSRLGQLELEVRSRKLSYRSEYRWMLGDIAKQMTELVMDRFAASAASFELDEARDAVTLYERFAFLRALISSEPFQMALSEIIRRPHVAWVDRHEEVHPGAALKANSYTIRQLSRPGARAPWPGGPLASIPIKLDRLRTEATHDTTPNRFVKFAIDRWRQVIADIDRGLAGCGDDPAVARGRREIAEVMEQLDTVIRRDLLRDLGLLTRFPSENQVLQRREGYRDVFRAYLDFELAARLSWRRTDQDYLAGQRDVAALYEQWAFIQLAQVVAGLVGQTFDLSPLIEVRVDGLNVVLREGNETVVSGHIERLGRKLAVELCFNRTFRGPEGEFGSWTRPMRPDYSLIVRAPADEYATFEPVLLHFDAKYRVEQLTELFGGDGDLANEGGLESRAESPMRGGVLRADLLKMHAYRDAIRRSAGAYVLYPGGDSEVDKPPFKEYHELLPGLGAFVLRPSSDGIATGTDTLRNFIDDVLDHVATRLSRHERGRYWIEEAYGQVDHAAGPREDISGSRPRPETTILLGYVKSAEHWNWITTNKAYNVRTEGRAGGVAANADLLFSTLLLLYSPATGAVKLARIVSNPELIKRAAMERTGYPDPASDYLCVQLSWALDDDWITGIRANQVDEFVRSQGRLKGEPTAARWMDVENLRRG